MNSQEIEQSLILAEHHFRNNNYKFSEEILKKITRIDPLNTKANELLAYIYGNQGESSLSFDLLNIASKHPNCSPEALYYLGSSLLQQKKFDQALEFFSKSLDKAGDFFEGLHNIATTYAHLGETEKALNYYQKCLKFPVKNYQLHFNIARCLDELNRLEDAIQHYQHAIKLNPSIPETWFNLGISYSQLGKFSFAIESYSKAIELRSDYFEAYIHKGNCLCKTKKYKEAITNYSQALQISPNLDFIFGDLLHTKMKLCEWSFLEKSLIKCIEGIQGGRKIIQPFPLLSLVDDPATQKKCAEIFSNNKFTGTHTKKTFIKQRTQKIRLGYFSADFKDHPVTTLITPIIELHNREKFEILGFSFSSDDKSIARTRLANAFDEFIDLNNKTTKQIENILIHSDIDIAIDLGGHTAENRLYLLEKRVAPIQISYIGYIGTLGTKFIDYLIADHYVIPEDLSVHYSEKIIGLPIYQTTDNQINISPKKISKEDLGLPNNCFVFCCFNNNYKFTPELFDSWARILQATKDSVLLLYAENEDVKTNLKKEAALRKLDPSRLLFTSRASRQEYLARLKSCDLFLDTFPYNAGTTASDALQMDLLVLTYSGQSFVSRMAGSLLNSLGLNELITNSLTNYEKKAIEIANNPDKYQSLKRHLALHKFRSPLFNNQTFMESLEIGFESIHKQHMDGKAPTNIYLN